MRAIFAWALAVAVGGVGSAAAAQPSADASLLGAIAAPPGIGYRWADEGPIFTDTAGMALYVRLSARACKSANEAPHAEAHPLVKIYFEHKVPACLQQWPPLLAAEGAKPVGEWTIVDNADGKKQWAYQGHTVHTSYKDNLPGDVNGFGRVATNNNDGAKGEFGYASPKMLMPTVIRQVFRPGAGVGVQTVDGKALYVFPADRKAKRGQVSLNAALKQERWKPVSAGTMAAPTGRWTAIDGPGAQKIWAYEGSPVFTYNDDYEAIDVNGVGLDGADLVLVRPVEDAPKGFFVTRTIQGPTFVDSNGMTLYDFHCYLRTTGAEGLLGGRYSCDNWNDDPMHAEQYCRGPDKCADMWRPVLAPANTKARGGAWTVAVIPDPERYPLRWHPLKPGEELEGKAVKAWVYRGRVLYTATVDHKPGDHWGQVNNGYHAGSSWWPVLAGMRDEGR